MRGKIGNGPISTSTVSVMEVKLSQRNRPDRSALIPKLLPEPTLHSQSHCFSLKTWDNTKRALKNQFRAISLRWRFQLQDISKDQLSTKHHFVHVVKEGETFTSISKQYGVSPHSIVIANKNILDSDLICKGQHIKIPSAIGNPQMIRDRYQLQEKLQSSLNRLWNYKNHFTLASTRLSPVRTIGFIVLVPLIVFCVRCIIGASHSRVYGTLRLKSVNKSEGEHEFRNGHWRTALRDIRGLDGLDSESSVDSISPSEDEQICHEDLSHAYKKLDQDYEKFLSECGLSTWGCWRGGSPEP